MKKFNQYLQKYLVYGSPFVMALVAWDYIRPMPHRTAPESSLILKCLWEVMSWNLILWFLALIIFMVMLVINKESQEQSVKFLAGIKERDEREQLVTGIAARTSFVATTSLLIFLLFMSCFTLRIAKNPDASVDGKKSSLTIGFKLDAASMQEPTNEDGVMYERKDIPLSKSGIILLILIWQVTAFRIKVRKEIGAGEI